MQIFKEHNMPETIDAASPNPYGTNGSNEKDVSSSITVTHVMYGLHALAPFTMQAGVRSFIITFTIYVIFLLLFLKNMIMKDLTPLP